MKYEYNIITRAKDYPLNTNEMNLYGISGWELVQVIQREKKLDYIFKRIKNL